MPKPRTILGPGILSAALVLSSCGSPNPRAATVVSTGSAGVTAMAVAPSEASSSASATIRSELGGSSVPRRPGPPVDAS